MVVVLVIDVRSKKKIDAHSQVHEVFLDYISYISYILFVTVAIVMYYSIVNQTRLTSHIARVETRLTGFDLSFFPSFLAT